MQRVAHLAGVSTSTVSRVVNEHPSVASETAAVVRKAMRQLSFSPAARRRWGSANGARSAGATAIGFVVFGTSGSKTTPAFDNLLRGVSAAANDNDLSLMFSFVSDPSQIPGRVLNRHVDGLLLHGERPGAAAQARFRALPTVWLMGNRQRPQWGDQVMPENTVIGELAANYLVRRGHHSVGYVGTTGGSWSLSLRALAFARSAIDAGATVEQFVATENRTADFWGEDGLASAADDVVAQLLELKNGARPTGLFIAEDRLLPAVSRALLARGVRVGDVRRDHMSGGGADLELVSCNNERPHLSGVLAPPATIDIRAESIGRRGVEQLLWRMRNRDVPERVRVLVEPVLLEPGRQPTIDIEHVPARSAV
jgi:LacI family transcriptional regulator